SGHRERLVCGQTIGYGGGIQTVRGELPRRLASRPDPGGGPGSPRTPLHERVDPRGVNMIRVALIGYGYAGRTFHAPLIRATPGLELVAVSSSRPARVTADLPGTVVVPSADD